MGGVGGLGPKKLCTKMARPDCPDRQFRSFPRWSLWSWGGSRWGGGGGTLPILLRCTAILMLPWAGGEGAWIPSMGSVLSCKKK